MSAPHQHDQSEHQDAQRQMDRRHVCDADGDLDRGEDEVADGRVTRIRAVRDPEKPQSWGRG
ncbi:hypothetical protein [Streptomyces sp. NPDC014623]|uniref:hypothetical protein n=1 Tax=Streptomyces sp. NPDC014623 TaxID=3364875 RepID=UPI0036FF4171